MQHHDISKRFELPPLLRSFNFNLILLKLPSQLIHLLLPLLPLLKFVEILQSHCLIFLLHNRYKVILLSSRNRYETLFIWLGT